MSEKVVVTWDGQSGKTYRYRSYPIGTKFRDQRPANYIFAVLKPQGGWIATYIGQTDNISECVFGQDKEGFSRRNSAKYIHVHLAETEEARLEEEKDLIAKWHPKCN